MPTEAKQKMKVAEVRTFRLRSVDIKSLTSSKGAFGEVRLGEHPLNDEKVALKFVNKRDILTISAAGCSMTEIQCLATLKHPNIITLYQHVELCPMSC